MTENEFPDLPRCSICGRQFEQSALYGGFALGHMYFVPRTCVTRFDNKLPTGEIVSPGWNNLLERLECAAFMEVSVCSECANLPLLAPFGEDAAGAPEEPAIPVPIPGPSDDLNVILCQLTKLMLLQSKMNVAARILAYAVTQKIIAPEDIERAAEIAMDLENEIIRQIDDHTAGDESNESFSEI